MRTFLVEQPNPQFVLFGLLVVDQVQRLHNAGMGRNGRILPKVATHILLPEHAHLVGSGRELTKRACHQSGLILISPPVEGNDCQSLTVKRALVPLLLHQAIVEIVGRTAIGRQLDVREQATHLEIVEFEHADMGVLLIFFIVLDQPLVVFPHLVIEEVYRPLNVAVLRSDTDARLLQTSEIIEHEQSRMRARLHTFEPSITTLVGLQFSQPFEPPVAIGRQRIEVEQRGQTLLAFGFRLCVHHPRGFVEQNILHLLVLL